MTKINHRRKNKQRKEYTKSKANDKSCRCHGSCAYCTKNRLHKIEAAKLRAQEN